MITHASRRLLCLALSLTLPLGMETGCSTHGPEPAPSVPRIEPTLFGPGERREAGEFQTSKQIAVARVVAFGEECTGAGGLHVVMEVVELTRGQSSASPVENLYIGGRGWWPIGHSFAEGDLFLATFDSTGPLTVHGPCVGLPPAQGVANALLPVDSLEHAHILMRRIGERKATAPTSDSEPIRPVRGASDAIAAIDHDR